MVLEHKVMHHHLNLNASERVHGSQHFILVVHFDGQIINSYSSLLKVNNLGAGKSPFESFHCSLREVDFSEEMTITY